MGKHLQIICEYCSKEMRSDNLKRHMKKHVIKKCLFCNKKIYHIQNHIIKCEKYPIIENFFSKIRKINKISFIFCKCCNNKIEMDDNYKNFKTHLFECHMNILLIPFSTYV